MEASDFIKRKTLVPIQNKGRKDFWKSFQKIKSFNGMSFSSRRLDGKGKRELKNLESSINYEGGGKKQVKN